MEENHASQSRLVRGLDVFGNVFVLNILFVVCCIPVVTIGASLTALYSVMLRMARKEEGTAVHGFFHAFKANFKQATIAWLIVLVAFVAIWGEVVYIMNFDGVMASVYTILVVVEAIVLLLTLPFLFPLIARFDNTIWNTFRNAFLLSVSNLGSWLKVFLAWFAPLFISFYYEFIILSTWYLWLLILFGLIAYGTSFTLRKVFDRVGDEKEKKIEKEKQEFEQYQNQSNGLIRKRAMMGQTQDSTIEDTVDTKDGVDAVGAVDTEDGVDAVGAADTEDGVDAVGAADAVDETSQNR